MAIEWKFEPGNLLVYSVTGTLGQDEYLAAQQDAENVIKESGNIRILIHLQDFGGWAPAKNWGDLSFNERNDSYIDKIAIVGDMQWESLVYAFTLEGLRPMPIKYFDSDQESRAKKWLDE